MGILRDATLHFISQCFPTFSQRLHVSLSRGHVDSTDIVISKSDPISVGNIPWQVVDGKISGLSLQLPWMNPRTAKFNVRINSVYIRLAEIAFPNSQGLVFRAISDENLRSKFRTVAGAEQSQAGSGGYIRNFVSQVLERIELLVKDLTMVIEFVDGSVGTFGIAKLRTSRSEEEEISADASPALLVSIEGLSVIIRNDASESELPMSIPEFSAVLRIELAENSLKADLDISRIVEVFVDATLREWANSLQLRQRKWLLAHKWDRPSSPARDDARSWIRYAFRRMSAYHSLRRVQFDEDTMRQSLGRFIEYKRLHVKRLHKLRLKREEINRIAILEGMFDTDMILMLRRAAKREVDVSEVFQFGTSEWLRWILFGHSISYERERLAANLTQSLKSPTGQGADQTLHYQSDVQNRHSNERYVFQFRLTKLAAYVCSGNHDLEVSIAGLGLRVETNLKVEQFSAGLSLQGLVCSVDGETVVHKMQTSGPHIAREEALLDASLLSKSNGISSIVNLHSLSVMLDSTIIGPCVYIVRRWMSPLPSAVCEQQKDETRHCSRDARSPFADFRIQNIVFIAKNTYVLAFINSCSQDSKNPEVMMMLRQLEMRLTPPVASFTPELVVSLSLRLSEVDAPSALSDYTSRTEDLTAKGSRQEALSVSTDFKLCRTPVLTVDCSRVDGFVDTLKTARLAYSIYISIGSQILTLASQRDENKPLASPGRASDIPDPQKHTSQSGIQLSVSSLRVDVRWGVQPSSGVFTFELKRLDTCLSSMSFVLISLRVESITCSSDTVPLVLRVEPTDEYQHALRLKGGCRSKLQGKFYEVLIGDISGRLSSEAILAVLDLVSELVNIPHRSAGTTLEATASQSDEKESETLISLLASSLRIGWSYAQFNAEFNCLAIQATAEENRISGSVESVALIEVDANRETVSLDEIIVQSNESIQNGNVAARFLCEPNGNHIVLQHLSASARRSFWELLVLSVADIFEKIEARSRKLDEKHSMLSASEAASDATPVTIEGSEIAVFFPDAASNTAPLVHVDIHHIVVCLWSSLQRISLRRTSILLKNSQQSSDEKGARILSAAYCEISHKTRTSTYDSEFTSHVSDVWDLGVLSELTIALCSQSIMALRKALTNLLTPVHSAQPSKTRLSPSDLFEGTPVDERFQVLFRCSVPSLRVVLGTTREGSSFDPFITVVANTIRLSIADARVGISTNSFDVVVLTLSASVGTINLFKSRGSSPDSLRMVIGGEATRFPHKPNPQECEGFSFRLLTREDHGQYTTSYDVHLTDVSIMYDLEAYENIVQFAINCFDLLNTSNGDIPEGEDHGAKTEHSYSEKSENSTSQVKHDKSPCYNGQRAPPHSPSLSKVAVSMKNFNFLCSMDHSGGSTLVSLFHVQKATGGLVMSSSDHQESRSTIGIEGLSLFVEDILRHDIDKNPSFQPRSFRERSPYGIDDMQVPMLLSPLIVCRAMNHSAQKLLINARFITTSLSLSHTSEFVVTMGNVALETSVESLLRLTELIVSSPQMSPASSGTLASNGMTKGLTLRIHVRNALARLSLMSFHEANHSETPIIAVVRVSIKNVADNCFKAFQGFVRVSLEITDTSTGHCDTVISPCKIRYRISTLRDWHIETRIDHLLRVSLSPVTIRFFSALGDILQKSTLMTSTYDDTSQAGLSQESKLNIRVHGVAVRCQSDTPRIQVLRLLLGKTAVDIELNTLPESMVLQVRVREFLLEDTISWRLFREHENESPSRRWERMVSSVRQPNDQYQWDSQTSGQVEQVGMTGTKGAICPGPIGDSALNPALQCQFVSEGGYENFKGRISLSGVDLNLDLAAIPIVEEWCNSLLCEFSGRETSESNRQDGPVTSSELAQPTQRTSWISELCIEPLMVRGSVRAIPRRLQQSIFERILTGMLDVEAVTGISLHLPAVHVREESQGIAMMLQKVLSEYSHSAISREFFSGILTQSGKFTRLARMFILSLFRRRPYNPLRLSTDKPTVESRSQNTLGLLGALDSAEKTCQPRGESSRITQPLIIHRIDCARKNSVHGDEALLDSSNILDLT